MRRPVLSFITVLLSFAACREPTAISPPVDHDAQGSWLQDMHRVVTNGQVFHLELAEIGGTITGSGYFAGEAAPYGTLSANGSVVQDSLHLQIVFVFDPAVFPQLKPDTAQFAGLLVTKDEIAGQITNAGSRSSLDLVRLKPADDPP